jgi:hypothetical protein
MGNSSGKKKSRELEKWTKPTGIYETCPWDERVVRKLILDKKLAPMFPGADTQVGRRDECPICFMVSPSLLTVLPTPALNLFAMFVVVPISESINVLPEADMHR